MITLIKIFILAFLAIAKADDCNCRLKTENRIINGQISTENFLPWIVSLASRNSGNHFCGGAIMNEKYILTAAHCVHKNFAREIVVRVGIFNIEDQIGKSQIYDVKKVHLNKYKNPDQPGDIAILELNKNITFIDSKIEKGCFNLEKREYSDPLLAAGWGSTKKTYREPNNKKLILNGQANKLKHAFFKSQKYCDSYLICLKYINKGDSVCHGDSGGPLHYTENGITKIEGVASFVDSKDDKNQRTVYCNDESGYSRLSYYADWISEIADFNFCGTGPKTEPKYKKKIFGIF